MSFVDDLPKPSPRIKKDKARQAPELKSIRLDEPKNLRVNFLLYTSLFSQITTFAVQDFNSILKHFNFMSYTLSKMYIIVKGLFSFFSCSQT